MGQKVDRYSALCEPIELSYQVATHRPTMWHLSIDGIPCLVIEYSEDFFPKKDDRGSQVLAVQCRIQLSDSDGAERFTPDQDLAGVHAGLATCRDADFLGERYGGRNRDVFFS
jgi:hypothetical protein